MKKNYIKFAKQVINLEINALEDLKKNLNNSFNLAVEQIVKCQSKVVLSGVGKSGLIASKISATLSSVGTPSFYLSASDSSHGDLGVLQKKDLLILISYSGKTSELKNIINYANRNNIFLIGIVSKKDSLLYKAADIKLLIPQVKEAAGIIPTSSTTSQLALGDALAIASMKKRNFNNKDFKAIHPAGSLGAQLMTVEDIMYTGEKIPFANEKINMNEAIKIINLKKLGVLILKNNKGMTTGILTDGDIKRLLQKNDKIHNLKVKSLIIKNPVSVNKDILAAKALTIMNEKKITCLCVHEKNKKKTIGLIDIHSILNSKIL